MKSNAITSYSGRALEELTIEGVLSGRLNADDFRISSETLVHQAEMAEAAGYRQFADNLRRAAELTNFTNQELIDIYDLLRPGRASHEQLIELAKKFELERGSPRIAALIREAAEVYHARALG
jgi:propanediol dehydratase small subunit